MYKVPQYILKDCKDSIAILYILLDASTKGAKLKPSQIKKHIENGRKQVKILELNYYV